MRGQLARAGSRVGFADQRTLAQLLAIAGLVGTVVGRADDRLVGRPFGVGWPAGRSGGLLFWGTAVSGPLAMDGLLLVLAAMRRMGPRDRQVGRALRLIGLMVVIGQCAEPVTFRRKSVGAAARAVMASNLVLGTTLAVTPGSGISGSTP